ncbi:MAG TPA: hypothetical protein GX702_07565 [Chloroflexi bacterium]|jgi:hypothetical protein|nr:hypothetical protein [Chloroflexota bacterium]
MYPSPDYKLAEYRLDELIREAAEERLGRRIAPEHRIRRGILATLGLWRAAAS